MNKKYNKEERCEYVRQIYYCKDQITRLTLKIDAYKYRIDELNKKINNKYEERKTID